MFDAFEQELRDALAHLYDPIYSPPELLCDVLAYAGQPSVDGVQKALLVAISQLAPGADVPPTTREWRVYDLLSYRYVHELTQEETAQKLGISSRHLRREQQLAVHVLAHRLWNQYVQSSPDSDLDQQGDAQSIAVATTDGDWRSQVRQELASLDQIDPDAVADIGEVIGSISELVSRMADRLGVRVAFHIDEGDLTARVHPALLRQILIDSLQTQLQTMSGGEIHVNSRLSHKHVLVSITGEPVAEGAHSDSEFVREAVALQGGRCDLHVIGQRRSFSIQLPHARQIVVLMIDDNEDLVHFFRRFTAHTRYRLVHVNTGEAAHDAIESFRPDLIVLDVMLPDIDGWEILTRLHDDPDHANDSHYCLYRHSPGRVGVGPRGGSLSA